MKSVVVLVPLALCLALSGYAKPSLPPAPDNESPATLAPSHDMTAMAALPVTVADWSRGALRLDGLGTVHRAITTSSPEAQQYFDQGMRLMWAFNHDEATRSFAKAAQLDPQCAICFWGVSLTVGPNYNLPFMIEERARVAFDALTQAQSVAGSAAPVEQALISALAKRYPDARPLGPVTAQPVLIAYAEAMKAVARSYPKDLDVQTLYAEALMNINAWKLWTADGKPAPGTADIVATLKRVLVEDPNHPGANHYYVHTIEGSSRPDDAITSAERLKTLMPGAGHMVHMPSHIMQRIGRYEEAAEANRKAAAADEAYVRLTRPPDYYLMYSAHNYQFLAYSAAMEGRRAETLAAVDQSRKTMSDEMLLSMPGADWYVAELYAARIRFGLWDDMLALPAPNPKLPGMTGAYLYGRAVALAATGRVSEAKATLAALRSLAKTVPADAPAGQNTLKSVLAIAIPIVQARIAGAEGRPGDAVTLLRNAVAAEDRITYDEPKNWFFPARHSLGALLLKAGKAKNAEAVYREDLRQSPANGWALHGLAAALIAQGRTADAASAKKALNAAWKYADVALTTSAY